MASAVLDCKVRSRRFAAVASVVFEAVVSGAKRVVAPRSSAIKNLRKIPLTVTGFGCIDVGVFTASQVAGWIVTGLGFMVLEYMIADEDDE